MAKNPLGRYDIWGIIFLLAIIIGIALLPPLVFKINLLLVIASSFLLSSGVVGIVILRRRVSALKRSNPEFFKDLEGEDSGRVKKCAVCGAESSLIFRCYYCTKYFCNEHKFTEKHHCSMAPKASFRGVLLVSTFMIFFGIVLLYVSPMISLGWVLVFGPVLIIWGIMFLIGRAWEERQNKRAMGLD